MVTTSETVVVFNKNQYIADQIKGRNKFIENQNESDNLDSTLEAFIECYNPPSRNIRLLFTCPLQMMMFPPLKPNLVTMCVMKISI